MGKARERVFEERKELVDTIIRDLENGEKPFWQKGWLTAKPINPTNGVSYRGINLIKLYMAAERMGFKDNRWLTYKQAESKKWKVKKGAKSTRLEFWKWDITKKIKDENGKEKEITEELNSPIASYFNVFNAEQIENIPENTSINEIFRNNELAEKLINNSEAKINYAFTHNAYYSRYEDKIVMPNREYFKTEDDFYAVIFHEMAHSTGHESRLNREMPKRQFDKKYAKEELIAEISSMFLQLELGIEISNNKNHFENHKAYIKHYIELLKETPSILFNVIREAEKASDYILKFAKK